MGVVKNLMVRAGADFSSFISESSKATTAAQRWSRGTSDAYKKAVSASEGLEKGRARLMASNDGWSRALGTVRRFVSAAALASFAREAINVASNLEEVQNVVSKSFGSMAGRAEEFSRTAITQFGLSELQAKQYSATFMSMASSMGVAQGAAADMSLELTGLTGDVASFFNLDQDTAYQKLRGVFTGETKALKDLGVVMTQDNLKAFAMSQGITQSYQSMSQAEKVALRYRFVMDALSHVQGDFADTGKQWANNVRTLKNQFSALLGVLGKGFIAVLNPVVTVLNSIMSTLVSFANGVSDVLSSVFGSAKTNLTATAATVDTSGLTDALNDVAEAGSTAAGSVDDVGNAASGAAKKAKELLGLLSFDKISKLPDSSSSSGGSGSGGGGSSGGGGGASGGGVSGGLADGAAASVLSDVTEKTEAFTGKLKELQTWLQGLNLKPLKEQWDNLRDSAGRLAEVLGEGLAWGVENVLEPLAEWTLEEAAPSQLRLLATSAKTLAEAIEVLKPVGGWLWDSFLRPLSEELGDLYTGGLEALSDFLEDISGGLEDIQKVMSGETTLGEMLKEWFTVDSLADFGLDLQDVVEKLGTIVAFVKDPINVAIALVAKDKWTSVSDWVAERIGTTVVEFAVGVKNSASEWWSNVKKWWGETVGAAASFTTNVKNEAGTWWSNVKEWWAGKVGAVEKFTTGVKNGASDWWSNVSGWWKGKVGGVEKFTTGVKNEAKTWWSNVSSWWSGKVGKLSVGISIANQAKDWWENVKSWWSDKAGKLSTKLNIKLPKITLETKTKTILGKSFTYPTGFALKWNAKGAILDGATLFGMAGNTLLGGGEAGREAVLPLDRNTGWMDQLADKVAQRTGGGAQQPIVVKVELEGRVIAESTVRELRRQVRGGGDPLAGLV